MKKLLEKLSAEDAATLQSLEGERVTHPKFGSGYIVDVEVTKEDVNTFTSNVGVVTIHFEDGHDKYLEIGTNTRFKADSEQAQKILDSIPDMIHRAYDTQEAEHNQKVHDYTIQMAKEKADQNDVRWYRFCLGKINTRPTDFPYGEIDKDLFVSEYQRLRKEARQDRNIMKTVSQIKDDPELKALMNKDAESDSNEDKFNRWLEENIVSINIDSPAEYYDRTCKFVSQVCDRADMVSKKRNTNGGTWGAYYVVNLKSDSIDKLTGKDDAFKEWLLSQTITKYNLKDHTSFSAPLISFDGKRPIIVSREFVLYLLDNYDWAPLRLTKTPEINDTTADTDAEPERLSDLEEK